jgi:perosamine synthetase
MTQRNIQIALPATGEEEWQAVRDSILSGWLTQGPKVAAFEKAFAERHGVKHAIATTSCTTGLHLALTALGIGPGDEVIVPAFTWISTANVVLYCGATPVFVDVDPETFNIDSRKIPSRVSEKTRAIIPVHLFGLCADMDSIREAIPRRVKILEDAACAAGASYKNVPAGSLGDAGVFSFHPRKPITTGEGGMVTTNDQTLAEQMVKMRNHGASISEEQRHHGSKPYLLPDFDQLGFNYRMTDIQGSIGLVQLGKLNRFIDERSRLAKQYQEQLIDIEWIKTPKEPPEGRHGWQSFVCMLDQEKAPKCRNDIMDELNHQGISTRPGTHAIHMLNLYKERFGLRPEHFPIAGNCDQNSMAIPLHNQMNEGDVEYVVKAIYQLK